LLTTFGVEGFLVVVVIREGRIDLTQCQMGALPLDSLCIPVVGETVESLPLEDFPGFAFTGSRSPDVLPPTGGRVIRKSNRRV
jgi:hypothetical protein